MMGPGVVEIWETRRLHGVEERGSALRTVSKTIVRADELILAQDTFGVKYKPLSSVTAIAVLEGGAIWNRLQAVDGGVG